MEIIMDQKVVAVALLTQRDLDLFGSGLRNVFPVDQSRDDWIALLDAIDQADKRNKKARQN